MKCVPVRHITRTQNVGYFITAQTPVVTCVLWNVWSW